MAEAPPLVPAQQIVLFDFDGVLFRGDAFSTFMRAHYARQWWRLPLALPLLLVVAPLAALRRGRRNALRVLVHVALLGLSASAYGRIAQDFGRSLAHQSRRFFAEGLRTIARHRQAGARVIVVTGCEENLARAILDELGLRDIELVASLLRQGRFGMRVDVHNIGTEKPRQLEKMGVQPPWGIAYGDTLADVAMLNAAISPVVVNASEKMLASISARIGRAPAVEHWY